VDRLVATELQLAGKPEPDTFLNAAEMLGVMPAAVVTANRR
jgi:beta-phosphoglucomutase-like phosphatase (HAD superfamily)